MNAKRLTDLISGSDKITSGDLADLRETIERYPFFGIGHMLYLKGLQQTDPSAYPAALKKSAVHVPDRSALYNFLKGHSSPPVEAPEPPAPLPQSREEAKENVTDRPSEAATPDPDFPPVLVLEPLPIANTARHIGLDDIFAGVHEELDEPALHDIVPPRAVKAPEITHEPQPETQNEEAEPAFHDLAPVEAFQSPEITHEPEPQITNAEADPAQREELQRTPKAERQSPAQEEESPKLSWSLNPEEKIAEVTPASSGHEPAQEIAEPKAPEPAERPADTPTPANRMKLGSFNAWLKERLDEKKNEKPEPAEPSKDQIIDKFIQAEPRISKPKAEFFNPVDVGKRSLVDDESIVTETLAAIYAEQGDYDKAISTYKKLSLIFPEKSSYFAALIYELEIKQSLE